MRGPARRRRNAIALEATPTPSAGGIGDEPCFLLRRSDLPRPMTEPDLAPQLLRCLLECGASKIEVAGDSQQFAGQTLAVYRFDPERVSAMVDLGDVQPIDMSAKRRKRGLDVLRRQAYSRAWSLKRHISKIDEVFNFVLRSQAPNP